MSTTTDRRAARYRMALAREYRRVRARQLEGMREGHTYAPGVAGYALRVARAELALQEAERDGRIRFDWSEYPEGRMDAEDQDYENEAQRLEYVAELDSGAIVVERCLAEVPAIACPHCGRPWAPDEEPRPEDWTVAASLHGIDYRPADDDGYRREVERDLADEAGVIS